MNHSNSLRKVLVVGGKAESGPHLQFRGWHIKIRYVVVQFIHQVGQLQNCCVNPKIALLLKISSLQHVVPCRSTLCCSHVLQLFAIDVHLHCSNILCYTSSKAARFAAVAHCWLLCNALRLLLRILHMAGLLCADCRLALHRV